MYSKTYLKGHGHLNVKVKVTKYQGQFKKKRFSVLDCNCFWDLCVTRMVCLRLKGINVD